MRTIVDLRGVNEAAETPHAIEGLACRVVGAHIEPGVGEKSRGAVADGSATPHVMMGFLTDHYRDYPRRCAPGFRTLFTTLADGTHRPLVFHCTAGKDRTGFASALLLTLLGVPWDAVMDDYLRTNELWTGHIGRYPELDIDTRAAIVEARTPYLEAAFEVVRADFGGPEPFAERALGLDAAALKQRDRGAHGLRLVALGPLVIGCRRVSVLRHGCCSFVRSAEASRPARCARHAAVTFEFTALVER